MLKRHSASHAGRTETRECFQCYTTIAGVGFKSTTAKVRFPNVGNNGDNTPPEKRRAINLPWNREG